jgi:type 2 lantibiotic biosynthesis protein LanM
MSNHQIQSNNIDLITSIVGKAITLSERLGDRMMLPREQLNEEQIEKHLAFWCQVVAKGDSSKFEKRLAWDGWELRTIRPFLGDVDNNELQALPSWAKTLEQVLQVAKTTTPEQLFAPQPYLNPEEPVAFEHFYLPCLQVAHLKLKNLVGAHSQLLAESAQVALERSLLRRLTSIASWTLLEEFTRFRSSGNSLRDFLLLNLRGHSRQEKYQAFIKNLFEDGLVSFFQEYSVLGRLLAQAIDFWVEANAEFIDRLAKDRAEIEQLFAENQPLGQVVDLVTGLSDSHHRGRFVISLIFDRGIQLIYKPKSLNLDVAFYRFVDWYNAHPVPLTLKVIKILNRQTYGWVEYVPFQDCQTEANASHFYQRIGMLMCLVYVLEGTDCHHQNLVAHGEHPVLIDLEALLHHRIKITLSTEQNALAESVLRTNMLPNFDVQWHEKTNKQLFDNSGVGGVHNQELSILSLKHINTDAMTLDQETLAITEANSPTLQGTPIFPHDYLENLCSGFEYVYRFLMAYQRDLLTPESCLNDLAHQKVRFVFRSTATYGMILQTSYRPMLLRSGIARSINLDILSRAFLIGDQKPLLWPILKAELDAMEEGDIPFFVADSSSDDLIVSSGAIVPKLFEEPSFKLILRRLQTLSEANLVEQIEIIRKSLSSRFQYLAAYNFSQTDE